MTPTIHYIVDACLLSATTLTMMAAAAWRQRSIEQENLIAEKDELIQSLDGEAASYSIMLTAQQDHLDRLEAAYKAAVPERMGNGRFAKKSAA